VLNGGTEHYVACLMLKSVDVVDTVQIANFLVSCSLRHHLGRPLIENFKPVLSLDQSDLFLKSLEMKQVL